MTWSPCHECGADGYVLKSSILGWRAHCPECGALLSYGVSRTDCMMNYTRTHRRCSA